MHEELEDNEEVLFVDSTEVSHVIGDGVLEENVFTELPSSELLPAAGRAASPHRNPLETDISEVQDAGPEDSEAKETASVAENEAIAPSVGSSRPRLDPVQLASILKDFAGTSDPLFANSPQYMAVIVKELLESDFLLVLGRGLGLSQIMRLFLAKVKQASPNALVLVLGRRHEEEEDEVSPQGRTDLPANDGTDEDVTIGFGINAEKRSRLYAKGGIYHITAPIAVVDILSGNLDCATVSGLVIAHSESVNENSTAAFFIRLLMERNSTAFIKALSDAPERLILPPALPLRLRTLGAKTIMLWPRFHLAVDRSLPKIAVEEIIVEQPEAVRRQQALLTELMQAVLSDIKRRVPHLDVEFLAPALGPQQPHENPEQLHALTTADAVIASPDLPWRIRRALQGIWHQLSRDGKRSVYSLGTLQQLQHTLTEFDALSFWSQLDFACRDTSEPWVLLPAADALVNEARREAALKRVPGKFPHLKELISTFHNDELVYVLCDSQKTLMEIHEYLSLSEEEQIGDESAMKALEESMRAADEEKARIRAAEQAAKVNEGRPGRRRVRGGKAPTPGRDAVKQEDTSSAVLPTNEDAGTRGGPNTPNASAKNASAPKVPSPHLVLKRKYEEIDLTTQPDDDGRFEFSMPASQARLVLRTYHTPEPLSSINPSSIVMYDPNLQYTREIERYVASLPADERQPTVYFMYYQKSVEELRYLTEMRGEKDAFTRLIREKGLMPMVLRDGEVAGGSDQDEMRFVGSSRRNYQVAKARQRVVVDTREFRSALPFLIYQSRMDVVPVTLLVGDYILTPDTVVERKSIQDLIGSFRDGRLYAQCESMQRNYKIAVLLIEFDNLSHFSMEPFKDIRTRQSADVQREIQENISALLLRFPKLKLIWSASPFHSAQIFKGLKEMEPEPEPEECVKAGQSVLFDSVALSMLEALPGITPGNSHLLAKRASTIAEICELDRADIVDALGPENGDRLYRFLTSDRPKN